MIITCEKETWLAVSEWPVVDENAGQKSGDARK